MSIKHLEEYRDPLVSKGLIEKIKALSRTPVRIMEVCGTHTMSIFRNGIRSVLPGTITLLSGPGCPVCVTSQNDMDAFIRLAQERDVIITTFGDLMRVPGSFSSLKKELAKGRDIRMVYSPLDALNIAKKNPEKTVVFLGVGFETTAPTTAAAILAAKEMAIDNFRVYSAHKLVPPALAALLEITGTSIDGFLLPGHVSVIIGSDAYVPVIEKYKISGVIAGFEASDILYAISMLVSGIEGNIYRLENAYKRAVTSKGNTKACSLMKSVYETSDACWRGLGQLKSSGLEIRSEFSCFDAKKTFNILPKDNPEPKGCACGEILIGKKIPLECRLFKKRCTPMDPVGPCMVSSEGSCAAYYKYHRE